LILLDIAMPDESGFDVIKTLKANTDHADIPVIFLSALTDTFNEALGIELGAVDYITKPFSEPVLLNRVRNHILIDDIIRERTEELIRMKDTIVLTLSNIIESRDLSTDGHIERTALYLEILINAMISLGIYKSELSRWDLAMVVSAARLHDVGKLYVPEAILNKPGTVTEEEFDIIKTHTTEGERIIDKMIKQTGEAEFLHSAKLVAGYHHERWDGTGYPYGLSEQVIPLPGRLFAIIDVYDALTSERPYRMPYTHEEAVDIIMSETDKHFDPQIAEVFYKINRQFMLA